MVKKHYSAFWEQQNIFIRRACSRNCMRSTVIPGDKGHSLSPAMTEKHMLRSVWGIILLKVPVLQYYSITNINCTAHTQKEHKQQYFKTRSSLRKCGCLINLKLELGITLEQLFGKTNQVQEGRKEAVWLSRILYSLNSTQKAYNSHS